MPDTPESRQLDLIREKFTETAGSFGDFALATRGSEAEKLASMAVAGAAGSSGWLALDLACGPGTFARALAARVGFVVGLDLTPALLLRARKALHEAVTVRASAFSFACGDGNRMPFVDGSFDLAACGYSIHHMLHPEQVIAELSRVVRPGGRVALVDMVIRSQVHRAVHTRIEQARDPSHTRALTAEEFHSLLEKVNLRVLAGDLVEKTRNFDEWMNTMKVPPGTPAYGETRRLLMATMVDDAAGMRPHITPEGKLEYTLPSLYVVAEKK